MGYTLGAGSLRELEGVHPDLVLLVKRAIQITTQDFSVHDGLRTPLEQAAHLRAGTSATKNSRHLTGHAVDLVPFIAGKKRWEWAGCFKIAVAMDTAATELGIALRWGGVWDKLLSEYGGSPEAMKKEVDAYCARHPGPDMIDGPHFELPRSVYP